MPNPYIYHYSIECYTSDGHSEWYHGKTDYPVPLTWHDIRIIAESEAPMRFASFGEFEVTHEEYR